MFYYSNEKNVQIVLALLKANGIKKVIASPGATNITVVASMQQDPFFEMYSCVDERSAAYMACGMSAESGEPVVISCTGATSSRNYMPGLTEAYYRKLPVIALTSSKPRSEVGHLIAQVTDRSCPPKDVVLDSFNLQVVKDGADERDCVFKMNQALAAIKRNGGGPIHLNLETTYSQDYSVKELPEFNTIPYVTSCHAFPLMPKGKIGVFIGAHHKMKDELTRLIDQFCGIYDAVVFSDMTSHYTGDYGYPSALVGMQQSHRSDVVNLDLLIHIGEVSGDYYSISLVGSAKQVWRVSEDGIMKDTFKRLTCMFHMTEQQFFHHYVDGQNGKPKHAFLDACKEEYENLYHSIPEDLPFSNLWIAKTTIPRLPDDSILYTGILNSLRCWDAFTLPKTVSGDSNVGGFGIDGGISTLVGASLVNPKRLCFGVFGDLASFYDINVLGNRHVGNNVRIMIINNGRGCEFRIYNHPGAMFGDDTDKYISAAGHNGNQSSCLLKHIAEDLGYRYFSASNKDDFLNALSVFVDPKVSDSMILECFTTPQDESDALYAIEHIAKPEGSEAVKELAKNILGNKGIGILKKVIK